MNRRGFTLIELLATIVVLGIVVSLTVVGVNISIKKAKKKTEEVYISTLRDTIKIYLDDASELSELNWTDVGTINKTVGGSVSLYSASSMISFRNIINSKYRPIIEKDMINPATEKMCTISDAIIHIYKDDDEVYYYYISKNSLTIEGDELHTSCLVDDEGYISNLPESVINSGSFDLD